MTIDNPHLNDNRKYNYENLEKSFREEYTVIQKIVSTNATLVDLGCGDGSLLQLLREYNGVQGVGVEISESGVRSTLDKGFQCFHQSIDTILPFRDNEFEYAVCNVTIQMVTYPEILMSEMCRVSKYQIISFPNFAFYKNRIDLLFKGQYPSSYTFGYSWYNTGHIHPFSLKDFRKFAKMHNRKELAIFPGTNKKIIKSKLSKKYPNLFELIPILLLSKADV